MSKAIFLFAFIVTLLQSQQIPLDKNCACSELLTKNSCNHQCQWDSTKNICLTPTKIPEPITSIPLYCDQFTTECSKIHQCERNDTKCTFFTSCTAYAYDNDEKCYSVSSRCISDGIHCVEKDICSNYRTQKACFIDNKGKYCYWNSEDTPKCKVANDCLKLPQILYNDTLCRAQLSHCTASKFGGCIQSAQKCQDQISQVGCVQNIDRTQDCYWKNKKCYDKTCENASTTLRTDKACKDFLQTCTTKKGGGCITRRTCSVAIEASCYTDNRGANCFWNGLGCANKICSNALEENRTNKSCQQYLSNCITNGKGCVDNIGCDSAKISEACEKNQNGQMCHWDGNLCKLKTCENAGPNYTNHELCTEYMNTCTVSGSSGCQIRQCDNAPLTFNTNDQCIGYIPQGNCITKLKGGCIINTTCENIDIKIACLVDINGKACFWHEEKCKRYICANSPSSNNTNESCQKFSSTCTIGINNTCVDKICENIVDESNCTFDYQSIPCSYESPICSLKSCSQAPKSITTHVGCQQYLLSCMLDKSGSGCMNIPNKCEDITLSEACEFRADGGKCGWQGTNCSDRTLCSTAPQNGTYNTTNLCNQYLQGCVVDNNLNGCMDLPATCSGRNQEQNCQVENIRNLTPKCQWNQSDLSCVDLNCENAHLNTLKNNVTQDSCWEYLSLKCVITTSNGISTCISRPSNCTGLIQVTCQKSQVLVGDQNCFWDSVSASCKSPLCSNITFTGGTTINHNACYTIMKSCTVDAVVGTGCIDLKSCNQYTFQDQCKLNIQGQQCVWSNLKCTDFLCENAEESTSYDSFSECQSYNSKCVKNQSKCAVKKSQCSQYLNKNNCQMNVISGQSQCQWNSNGGTCFEQTFDCGKITGVGLTASYCHLQNSTCSVNEAGTSCILAQNFCGNYTSKANCKWSIYEKDCYHNGTVCVIDCTFFPGPISADSCDNYGYGVCIPNFAGTKCVNSEATCSVTKLENCVSSNSQTYCYNLNSSCKGASNYLASNQCEIVYSLSFSLKYCIGISNNGCSINKSQTKCIQMQNQCSDYLEEDNCFYSVYQYDCVWKEQTSTCVKLNSGSDRCTYLLGNSVAQCTNKLSMCVYSSGQFCQFDCATAPGPFSQDYCYNNYQYPKCTLRIDETGCIAIATDCKSASHDNCTYSLKGYCYLNNGTCVLASSYVVTDCSTITEQNHSFLQCYNASNNRCAINALNTSCIPIKTSCSGYDLPNCFQSSVEQCVLDVTGTKCTEFSKTQQFCYQIKFYGRTNTYTNQLCQKVKSVCSVKSDFTGCQLVNCSSITGSQLTFQQCFNKECSVNAEKTACVFPKYVCSEYSVIDCSYALNEGDCIVFNGSCVQDTCTNAPITITDQNGCQSYSRNCVLKTVAGGCQSKSDCSSYFFEENCVKNYNGEDCLWNLVAGQCVNKSCVTAEESTTFDTHTECQTVGKCTVKANSNNTVGQGCIPLAACNTYLNSEQCQISDKGITCYWVANDISNQFCSEKSCLTAALSINTHNDCNNYFTDCTVNIVSDTPKGCITYKKCDQYAQVQCFLSSEKDSNNKYIECGWTGTSCVNKGCATAQNSVNTHTLCSQYWPGCTVNATDDGCIMIPSTCTGMTKNQCFNGSIDSSNRQCFWLNKSCVTKTCDLAPNERECDSFLNECTLILKCSTRNCESFKLTTDNECKLALPNGQCTTNGKNCVKRGKCSDVLTEAGCVTNNLGQLCQWFSGQCQIRSCENAPSTNKTEQACQEYFTPTFGTCTTKRNGGCVTKTTCAAANVQAACIFDNTGATCVWDHDLSFCRLLDCQDFNGSTHAACKAIKSTCTVGINGRCATIVNCQATTIQAACIEGKNGPCLWINEYQNIDGSKGACFPYESCRSLSWTSDDQCKLISPNCTTNGLQCIGITSCSETNINGGCKSGTDGECIQIVSQKGTKQGVCKKFSSCKEAYYLTHEECQAANHNCTSDYKIGCIQLGTCSSFKLQEQCHLNKEGILKDTNGAITSTGKCVWDSSKNICNDEQCKDIHLTNVIDCQNRLKSCTSDGTTCLTKGQCNTYTTKDACLNGGTEDSCFWNVGSSTVKANCRTKICTDILNGISASACSELVNCVSNGTNCIPKLACASYTSQVACMSAGTDGLCVWTYGVNPTTQGKCELMTGCSAAKNEVACKQANNRCFWNQTSCQKHSCESYQAQVKECKFYYTWDMMKYNICALKDGKCKATDATTLSEQDCYLLTAYQYSWNPSSSKCSQCGSTTFVNNSDSNLNQNNSSISVDGIIFAGAIVLVIQIII